MTGFYKRDEVCLLRGTDWIFKYKSIFHFTALSFLGFPSDLGYMIWTWE
jgi:hypothetical protein